MLLFWCCVAPLLAVILPFALFLQPTIHREVFKLSHAHLDGTAMTVYTAIDAVRHLVYCQGDYIACVKDELTAAYVSVYGWTGVAPLQMGYGYASPVHYSHARYKEVAYHPSAGRFRDMMVNSNSTKLPEGTLPDGEHTILLNLATGEPEHSARRKLLADALPALGQKPEGGDAKLMIPPGVKATDVAIFGSSIVPGIIRFKELKKTVMSTVGLNLFKRLFGADMTSELDIMFEYDHTFTPVVLGAPLSASSAKRLSEIRGKLMAKVGVTDISKNFLALAKERGMNGQQRLNEMLWIAMFAGYGGTGTLTTETIKLTLKDPAKYVKLYRKDPAAFILEAARYLPPVAGMNPFKVMKAETHQLANGRQLKVEIGQAGILSTSGANRDPAIFAESPNDFKPGRKNAKRLLSWNAELQDIEKCDSAALGCAEAPRPCPGTWLSLRIASEVVAFFMDGIQQGLAGKTEL